MSMVDVWLAEYCRVLLEGLGYYDPATCSCFLQFS